MIELKLTKCILYLTEQEIKNLLAHDITLWEIAIQRGKAFKRHRQAEQRHADKADKQADRQTAQG